MEENLILFDSLVDYFARNPLWREKGAFIPYLLEKEFAKIGVKKEVDLSSKDQIETAIKESYLFNLLADFLGKYDINHPAIKQNRIGALIINAVNSNRQEEGEMSDSFGQKKRIDWTVKDGAKWWEESTLEDRQKFNAPIIHKPSKTLINKFHIEIQDFSLLNETDCRFLKTLDSPSEFYFVYAVWNDENNTVKLGRARTPFSRVRNHADNFAKYGQTKDSDLFVCISRYFVTIPSNTEELLIKAFGDKLGIDVSAGREFFHLGKKHSLEEKQNIMREVFDLAFSAELYLE